MANGTMINIQEGLPNDDPALLDTTKSTNNDPFFFHSKDGEDATTKRFPQHEESRKHVRFAPLARRARAPSRHRGIPVDDLWYNDEDFHSFRQAFLQDSKKMARRDPSDNKPIVVAFERSKQERCDSSNDHTNVLDGKVVDALRKCLKDRSKIGLERFASRSVYRDKSIRRSRMWEAVMFVQDIGTQHAGGLLDTELDEIMRATCERISKPSVRFAHHVALCASKIDPV